MPTPDLAAAERFIWTNARLLDRHRFAHQFLDADPAPVLAALAGYANDDGGYGNALEPDLRTPASQPAAVETALRVLAEVDALDGPLGAGAVAWLERIAPDGGMPFMLRSALRHPRAPWWQCEDEPPGSLILTGFLAGTLLRGGVSHPWVERASAWCWERIESATQLSPYEARGALAFLDATPDADRAERALARINPLVEPLVARDPEAAGEHHTPLDLSPWPGARSRALFDDELVEAHLDWLAGAQDADGGWRFDWQQWSPAATAEWRGVVTIHALLVLRAHGRLSERAAASRGAASRGAP